MNRNFVQELEKGAKKKGKKRISVENLNHVEHSEIKENQVGGLMAEIRTQGHELKKNLNHAEQNTNAEVDLMAAIRAKGKESGNI